MSRNSNNNRRNDQKARTLRFENLEDRQMLDASPVSFVDSTSNVACYSNALLEEYPTIDLTDLSTDAPLSDGDTITFVSYYTDASGYALAPSYGETTFKRLVVKNTGTDTLTITSATLSEGSRVEFVGGYKSSLEPNEETILTLKWQALQAESSTLTILSDDPDQPTFELDLSGSIRANTTILPTLGSVSLLCDTGASSTDSITCNPAVTGEISGSLYGGRVDVEFDLDADSDVDAITQVYVVGDFTFDPSEYSDAFNPPESGTSSVTLRYRPAIYNAYGTLVERGSWQTFSYTLEPAPSASLTVSNLAVSADYDGDWTQPNATKLTGAVSGSGDRSIQVKINNQVYAYSTDESTFVASLPVGFSYGVATSIQARAGQYDSTTQRVLYGAWSTLNFTPSPCAVSTLALETDDGVSASDNISSQLTLVGSLVNGVGRNYAEVEFTCGADYLGSAYTDENGEFTFAPQTLPIANGVASGTIVARAVYRPESGAPIYGASESITITYAPTYGSDYYTLNLSLANPLTGSTSTTEDPRFNITGALPKDLDVDFEYRWKLSTDSNWSTPKHVYGQLDDELNTDENATNLYWNGVGVISALYNITTASATVQVQARPTVYSDVLQSQVPTASWTSYSFTFQKPTPDVPTISTLALADPLDAQGQVSDDAVLTGQIARTDADGSLSGVTINFYSGATLIGSTTTDGDGFFTYAPSGLNYGSQTITCKAKIWDATTRQYVEGTSQSLTFTYIAPTVAAPTLAELRLWDDTGVANDNITANATIYGQIESLTYGSFDNLAYLLVEYDLNADGVADDFVRADANGEFFLTPQLTPGTYTIGVRAARWDAVNQVEVAGTWSTITITVVAPSANTTATIEEFAPENSFLSATNQVVSYESTVVGRVTSETDYENLTVEYEVTSGGIPGSTTHSNHPDPYGRFCWTPDLAYSTTDTNVVVRSRVGRYDPLTQTTTWSAWITTSFIYRATTESVISTVTATASDRAEAELYELKFNGDVTPGVGLRTYYVEYDVDGDDDAEGRVTPNSDDEFVFYAVPTTTNLRVRVVDLLLNDTERISSQGWLTVATPNYFVETLATELNLYFEENAGSTIPYLQVENYQGSYSALTVSLDYDHDGKSDATVTPDSQGKITSSQIISALTSNDVEILPGLSIVFANISAPEAYITERVPFPLLTGADASEAALFAQFTQLFAGLVDYDPTDLPGASNSGSSSTSSELVYQETPENVTYEYVTLNVGSQLDHEILKNTPIPSVPLPNLKLEGVDLSNDLTLQTQLDAIEDAYDNDVRTAGDVWLATYNALLDQYNTAVENAWNEYSKNYARASQEYETLAAMEWSDTEEYAKIQAQYQTEIAGLAAARTSALAELTTQFNTESLAMKTTYDNSVWSGHTSACSGSNHSEACQTAQINAKETFYKGKIRLSLDNLVKQLEVDAEYNKGVAEAEARRDEALTDGESAFATQKESGLAAISRQSAEYGRDYQNAVASALYDFYAGAAPSGGGERTGGLAGADETYRNTVANLAYTATVDSWTAVRSAVNAWRNNSATDSTWGGYIDTLYGIAQTEDVANALAYKTAVQADAAAQKAADCAAVGAYYNYLTSDATAVCTRDQAAATGAETLQIAAITANATAAATEREAKLDAVKGQIDSALAIRKETIARMRTDGIETGTKLANRDRSLIGVTNYSQRWAIENATQEELSALWKSNAQQRLKNEVSIYDALTDLTATWEATNLSADYTKETALWTALGAYWKSEIAKDANYALALDAAACAYRTSMNAADETLLNTQIAVESSYDQAITNSEVTATTSEFTQTKNLWTSEYASYFNALSSACQNMTNSDVGDYYDSLVAAAQTDYNAQWSADTTYFNSVLAKEQAYANTTRAINANYTTAAIGAIYDYYDSQIVSSAASINRTKTSDQAEIDARIACYLAYVNADYSQAQTTLDAKTDSVTRKLDLLSLWSQHVIDKNWTYDTVKYGGYDGLTYSMIEPNNSNLTYASFTGGAVTSMPTAESVEGITIPGFSNNVPSSLGGMSLYCDYLMWHGYNPSTLWTALNNLNTATQGFQITNAQLASEASKKSAASQYVSTYAALYGAEAAASLTASSAALAAELVAEQTLNTAIWNASETAHNATLNATVASDDSSDVATYLNASVNASLDYAKSATSAFGTFQIDNRQTQYNNASANDPRKSLYAQGVSWATNTKSLRDQYYDVAGDAIEDYYTSITQAYTSYVSDVLSALTTAERSYFSAIKTYSINALAADSAYTTALFNAESTRATAYIDAALAQLYSDYSAEASLAASRASAYALEWEDAEEIVLATQFSRGRGTQLAFLQTMTSSEQTDYFDEIVDAATDVVAIKNAADSAAVTAASQNATALASAKAQNEAAYTAATENAELAYTIVVNNAWNNVYIARLGVVDTLQDAFETTNATLKNTLDDMQDDYRAAALISWDENEDIVGQLAFIHVNSQASIDFGNGVANDVFENPSLDFEVCFAAGTLVLMADGSKKPIEEIQPGDMVLATDHLNPEEKPEPAQVVRTFDNGLKDVVRLRFSKDGVEEEIVCTPSHRFYIIGRGWVCASEIDVNAFGLTKDGDRVRFLSCEVLQKKECVYNLEVKEKHTYFVGCKLILLSHNICPHCINGLINSDSDDVSVPSVSDVPCPCPCHYIETEQVLSNGQLVMFDYLNSWNEVINIVYKKTAEIECLKPEMQSDLRLAREETLSVLYSIRDISNSYKEIKATGPRISKLKEDEQRAFVQNGAWGPCVNYANSVLFDILRKTDFSVEGNYLLSYKNRGIVIYIHPIAGDFRGANIFSGRYFKNHIILQFEIGYVPDGLHENNISSPQLWGVWYVDNGYYGGKDKLIGIHELDTIEFYIDGEMSEIIKSIKMPISFRIKK